MKVKLIAAIIALAVAGTIQAADFISLNLFAVWPGQQISDGEFFGSPVDSTVTTNWSNHNGNGWETTKWNDGTVSDVGYVVFGGGYEAGGSGGLNTAMLAGRANFNGTANLASLTFTNLTATAFSEGYDVIVYLAGHVEASQGSITDGTTTYYFDTPDAQTSDLTLVTSESAGIYETGNYVKFTGLTADTFVITMSAPDTNWIGIGGAQVIDAPVGPELLPPELGLYIIH